MAPWPPFSPSTTKNSHSGRVRSNGSLTMRSRIAELAQRARLGESDVADVVVDVELGVVDPDRRGEAHRRGLDPLAQAGHQAARAFQASLEPLVVGLAIEDGDVADRRREVGVLVQPPHEGSPPRSCERRTRGGRAMGHAERTSRRPFLQRGIDVCLNSLRSTHPRVSTTQLDRLPGHSGVTVRPVHQPDKGGLVADDERRHAPDVVAGGVLARP